MLIALSAVGAVAVNAPATLSDKKYTVPSVNPVKPVTGPVYTMVNVEPVADCTIPTTSAFAAVSACAFAYPPEVFLSMSPAVKLFVYVMVSITPAPLRPEYPEIPEYPLIPE